MFKVLDMHFILLVCNTRANPKESETYLIYISYLLTVILHSGLKTSDDYIFKPYIKYYILNEH